MSRVFKVDYIPDPAKGRPLWNAKIFVGVANQDPTIPSNQIQLTGDIGFPVGQSIPVPQPVRTNAGGITVYNNSPLDLNAPGQEYAIQIFDRNDNLIYNFPQVDGVVAMDTTSQEEVTGLIVHPDVGIATPGQTVDAGVTAFRAVLNGSSRLFTTDRPVVTSGLLNSIVINQEYGTGTADVDGDIYQLRDYTTQTQEEITGVDFVNLTQEQVDAGFDLFPLIGQGVRVAGVGLWVVPSVTSDGSAMPNPAILDSVPNSFGECTINGGTDVLLKPWDADKGIVIASLGTAGLNDTATVQRAILAAKLFGVKLLTGPYFYNVDPDVIDLTDGDSIYIEGVGRFKCGFVPTGAGSNIITLTENALLSVKDLAFDCSTTDCGNVTGNANTPGQFIVMQAENCRFAVQGSTTKSGVVLNGFKQSLLFENNLFQGNATPSLTGQLFQLQRLLSIPDNGTQAGDENPVNVTGNRFTGGAVQFSNFGTDGPPSPLYLKRNTFINAYCRAIHAYHGEDAFITSNFVSGCQGQRPTTDLNNIGGAVWLDIFGAITAGNQNGAVYNDNIVRDCLGVAVFTEETYGVLSGWTVTNTGFFPGGYQYVGSEGFVTSGGYGFVVTSGSRRIGFQVRAEGNQGAGMIIDRTLGVDTSANIGVVDLQNCHIDENPRNGLIIRNQVRKVRVMGGTMAGNGFNSANTFDAISIEQDDPSESLTEFKASNVDFDDSVSTVNSRHCIGKTYSGLYLDVRGCTLNSLSEWIDSGGTVSGNIHQNRCLNDRDFNLSGSDVWFFDNDGYVSEVAIKETISNGFGQINHGLVGQANRVQVSVESGTTPVIATYTIPNTTQVAVRLFDTNGVAIVGDQDVTLRVSIAKSVI